MQSLQWTKRLNGDRVETAYLKHFGAEYREYRKMWDASGKDFLPQFPVNLDFEVVDSCNLRCLYCFRNKELSKKLGLSINTGKHLSIELFDRTMDEASKYGLKAVNFGFSGECLLSPDITRMIKRSRDSGVIDIRLITNGTLMTRKMLDELLNSSLTFLSFSIDAGSRQSYKALKGGDHFGRLLEMIKYAYEKRKAMRKDLPLIRASFYPSPENDGEEEAFLKQFEPYVDFIDFQAFQDLKKIGRPREYIEYCRMPFRRLAIFSNGDVAPCCCFFSKKFIVGNINRMTVKEIWDSDILSDLRKSLVNNTPGDICRECLSVTG